MTTTTDTTTVADDIREWGNFCSVSANDPTAAEQAWGWAERVERESAARQAELDALRAELAEVRRDRDWPDGLYRMQGKIERQRTALDRLQRRVENQRLVLRTINELGRGLTDEEWAAAKAGVASDQLRDRMTDKVPSVTAA